MQIAGLEATSDRPHSLFPIITAAPDLRQALLGCAHIRTAQKSVPMSSQQPLWPSPARAGHLLLRV